MKYKTSVLPYKKLRHLISMPFIFGMSVPLVIFDVTMEIYHRVAFPLYGLPVNKRSNYIRIDRQKLSYLSPVSKIYCMYCGYANGVTAYSVKIAGDTEKYWCGIKHQSGNGFVEQPHQKDFLEYNDKKAYEELIKKK